MNHDKTSPLGISGRIAARFQRHALTPLIALVAVLLGVFAVLITPREEEPQIDVTMANVIVPFPGASVQDVEALVARPAEEVISRIAGMDHVYSVSRPGMAILTAQFKVGVTNTTALVRLYDTLDSHRDWLNPELGVGQPIVKPKGIDDVPIVGLTLWTRDAQRSGMELLQIAHAVEHELKRVPGTRDVRSIGGGEHVLRVEPDPSKLAAFGLTLADLKGALALSNTLQSSGTLISQGQVSEVETGAILRSAEEVGELVVGLHQGKPVFLREVALIEEGAAQATRHVWHVPGQQAELSATDSKTTPEPSWNGAFPAVTIHISKKPGENATDVANALMTKVDHLRGSLIPDGVEVTTTRNYGETANEKAQKLIGKLIFATAAVVALVGFALGRREAVIVGVAVMLTLTATLFASWAWGFTLNRVSLFALIFSIGILVDDAIVVVENIHRHQQLEPQKSLLELIPQAVDEVGGPTILATFTVIAALLPMAFVSGLMGPYMAPIPINASMGMVISLAIAFVVTPWLTQKLGLSHSAADGHGQSALTRKIERVARRVFAPLLDRHIGGAMRLRLWLGVIGLIIFSVALPVAQLVLLKMLPFDNKSEFQVVVDMPVGTPLEDTQRVLQSMAAYLSTQPEVAHVQTYAGTASPINFNGLVRQYYLRGEPYQGDIQVNLVPKSQRHEQSHAIATRLQPEIARIAQEVGQQLPLRGKISAKVVEVPPGPPVMAPIVAEVYGPDYQGQLAVAGKVREIFDATTGVVGTDDSREAAADKFTLRVLPAKAAQHGVSIQAVADSIRTALSGENVTPLHGRDAKYEIPVRVQLPAALQGSLEAVMSLRIRARDGQLVPVSELVEIQHGVHTQTIFHKDLLPVVYVTGDMSGKVDSPLYGLFAMRNAVHALDLNSLPQGAGKLGETFITTPENPYAGYSLKWDGEWQITYETFRDMGAAYAVGLVLIYLLVVAHFRSYLMPVIIMVPIPLTIIGVMPGHALLGAQFTATSMIGMIALAGIIVRNSILLVDFMREEVARGVELGEAVIRAAAIRAQPILLTALAAMTGALFILDDPIFNGLAISLIFGIMVSTLLTLVVIPLLYYVAFKERRA